MRAPPERFEEFLAESDRRCPIGTGRYGGMAGWPGPDGSLSDRLRQHGELDKRAGNAARRDRAAPACVSRRSGRPTTCTPSPGR